MKSFLALSLLPSTSALALPGARGSMVVQGQQVQHANHIFNAIHDSMRQWGSSLNHNGMSLFIAEVPEDVEFYHGTSSPYRVNGTEWLAFEPEHALMFARGGFGGPGGRKARGPPGGPDGGTPPPPPPGTVDGDEPGPHHEGPREDLKRHEKRGPSYADLLDDIAMEKPIHEVADEERHGYLHTYRTKHPLRLLYLDGQSAAKSDKGTLDIQDLVLLHHEPPVLDVKPKKSEDGEDCAEKMHRDESKPEELRKCHEEEGESHHREGRHYAIDGNWRNRAWIKKFFDEHPDDGPERHHGPPDFDGHHDSPSDRHHGPPPPPPPGHRPPFGPPPPPEHLPPPPPPGSRPPHGDEPDCPPPEWAEAQHEGPPREHGPPEMFRDRHNEQGLGPAHGTPEDRHHGQPGGHHEEGGFFAFFTRPFTSNGPEDRHHRPADAGRDQRPFSDKGPEDRHHRPGHDQHDDQFDDPHLFDGEHPPASHHEERVEEEFRAKDESPPHHGPMGEGQRADRLCRIAKKEWDGRIDGFLRMEGGFEIIICDFANHLDVVQIGQAKSGGRPGEPGGRDEGEGINSLKAVAARYDGIGGDRVKLDYNNFVTLFTFVDAIFFDETGRPRVKNGTDVIAPVRDAIKEMVLRAEPEKPKKGDWQAVADMIVTRYADRIEYLSSGSIKDLEGFKAEVDRALRPFINYGERNATREIARCASQFLPSSITPSSPLAVRALESVSTVLCRTLSAASQTDSLHHGLSMIRGLKSWLGWTEWKKCRGCGVDEVCFLPIWPMGTKEDFEHPTCKSGADQGHGGYWGGFGPRPPPRKDE
jgi:hypothetical protein